MAAKPESVFTSSVDRHLPIKLYRMKTHNPYEGGIFDKWYSGKLGDLWVEYKFILLPKRDTTVINFDLSELQLRWGRERLAEGRSVVVIVGCKEGGILLTDLEWENPMTTADFKARLLRRPELAAAIVYYTGGAVYV